MSEWVMEFTSSNWSLSSRSFPSSYYTLQLPTTRNADFIFDFSKEAPFNMMLSTVPFIFAAGFAMSVLMGAIGVEAGMPGVLVATFLLSAGVRTVSGLGFLIVTGNKIAYSSVWITTPQVCLDLHLRNIVACFGAVLQQVTCWLPGPDCWVWNRVLRTEFHFCSADLFYNLCHSLHYSRAHHHWIEFAGCVSHDSVHCLSDCVCTCGPCPHPAMVSCFTRLEVSDWGQRTLRRHAAIYDELCRD
jgi:hypothetical protein